MKQTVQGVLYDTDTARLIGEDRRHGSFLYQTEEGEFFIYHEISGYKDVPPFIEAISAIKAKAVFHEHNRDQLSYDEVFGTAEE